MRRAIAGLACLLAAAGCRPAPVDVAEPAPALVREVVQEADLGNVELSEEAAERLGIETVSLALRPVQRTRSFAGDLIVPLAASERERSLYALVPTANTAELGKIADLQIQADGVVEAARVGFEAARTARTRAEDVRRGRAGSERAVDEARAQEQLALAALRNAQARRALLGAPLFSAVASDVLWLHVAVHGGELAAIDAAAPARLAALDDPSAPAREASPIPLPVAGPGGGSGTVDLYYAVANESGAWRPGQPVIASIPLRGPVEAPVVPRSAVLYDIHGDTWVYEEVAPHRFARRRVSLLSTVDGEAALASGPLPGARIVREGAAELFGVELGFAR